MDDVVGTTLVSVEVSTFYAREIHFGDWMTFERTTLVFSNGRSHVFTTHDVDYDASTETTTPPPLRGVT